MVAMNSRIVNVDQMDNGVLVNFADGARSFFDAVFLYEQLDKRLESPLKSDSSKRSSSRLPRRVRDAKRS
jgi:hypothetical protein